MEAIFLEFLRGVAVSLALLLTLMAGLRFSKEFRARVISFLLEMEDSEDK